jgi:aminopeptidase YwaD
MVKGKGKLGGGGRALRPPGSHGPDALFPGAERQRQRCGHAAEPGRVVQQEQAQAQHALRGLRGRGGGLVGSEWFAVDRPIELAKVKLMVNLDILGTGDDGIMVVNATAQAKHLRSARGLEHQGQVRSPRCARARATKPEDRLGGATATTAPSCKRNVPALFIYTHGCVPHYHDVLDTGGDTSADRSSGRSVHTPCSRNSSRS